MAALFLHGLRPGPTFMFDNLGMFEYMVAGLVIGAFLMLFVGLALAHVIVHVLLIPRENIMAAVLALAAIGAYASKLQYGDVWMMVAFGAVAYVLRRLEFPLAPLVLGLVLGRMFDDFLRTALIISGGDLAPLYQRPICLVLLIVLVVFFVMSTPAVRRLLTRMIRLPASAPAGPTNEQARGFMQETVGVVGVIGFIGLGAMGLPIACRLARAGFRLAAFDPDPAGGRDAVLRRGRGAGCCEPARGGRGERDPDHLPAATRRWSRRSTREVAQAGPAGLRLLDDRPERSRSGCTRSSPRAACATWSARCWARPPRRRAASCS